MVASAVYCCICFHSHNPFASRAFTWACALGKKVAYLGISPQLEGCLAWHYPSFGAVARRKPAAKVVLGWA